MFPMKKGFLLKRISLFTRLSRADLDSVARIAKIRETKKNETIFSKAAVGDTLYVVMRGRVKIFGVSSTGKAKTFAFLEPGDFFGEMALLEKGDRSASAKAVMPSALMTIHRRDFQNLLRRRPGMALAILHTLCRRLRRADREIEALSFNNVLGRLARILVDLSDRYGRKAGQGRVAIQMQLSHQDLAEMAGTAREMVTRILNRFRRTGCLEMNGKSITLTDVSKLHGWIY
jgi:CRP-like cAMP-binding protein